MNGPSRRTQIATIALDYGFGWEAVGGFRRTFEEQGGRVVQSLWTPLSIHDFAPYLAQILPGSKLERAILGEGWGRSWGVLLAAEAPFAEVRRHLRRYLVVETEASQPLSFRFYDPRVLAPFLGLAIRYANAKDLRRLKHILESRDTPSGARHRA